MVAALDCGDTLEWLVTYHAWVEILPRQEIKVVLYSLVGVKITDMWEYS